eukprot:jgi/Chlat1/4526/Chrsp29S04583
MSALRFSGDVMLSLARVMRAATASGVASRFYNSLYRQTQCTYAAKLQSAYGTATSDDAVDTSNKLPPRRMGRPPLPPWSEAEQQAVRQFWERLALPPQRVAFFVMQGTTKSLFRNPTELERRMHEMRKLIPGASTATVALLIDWRRHETLASNLPRLKTLLDISDNDLCMMLRSAPHMLAFTPEHVAERFAAWRTFLAVEHADMVALLKRCPSLVCCNDASVRGKLQTFLDAFECSNLGSRRLAMQIFMCHPGVVVLMSCERTTTRLKRLATDFTEAERSTWSVPTWQLALSCRDYVLDPQNGRTLSVDSCWLLLQHWGVRAAAVQAAARYHQRRHPATMHISILMQLAVPPT